MTAVSPNALIFELDHATSQHFREEIAKWFVRKGFMVSFEPGNAYIIWLTKP